MIISLSRKPLVSSVISNIFSYNSGGLDIDKTRITSKTDYFEQSSGIRYTANAMDYMGSHQTRPWVQNLIKQGLPVKDSKPHKLGRWPSNVILEHKFDCMCLGNKQIKGHKGYPNGPGGVWSKEYLETKSTHGRTWNDPSFKVQNKPWENTISKDGLEDISLWNCSSNCPVELVGQQSGICAGWRSQNHNTFNPYAGQSFHNSQTNRVGYYEGYNDTGNASRFFKQMQEDKMNKIPQDLIDYIITLISPPDDKALFFNTLDEIDFKSYKDNTICGILVRGTPTEEQSREFMRILKPGAHLMLMSPEEEPTGHTGTCRIEDAGFEIRDAILYVDEPKDFHYIAKAARSEREEGCERLPIKVVKSEEDVVGEGEIEKEDVPEVEESNVGVHNAHPTVKPIALMEKLLADVPKDVVLDPFTGSGSTGIACVKTGHSFIGIEKEPDYFAIADARIKHWCGEITPWVGRVVISDAKQEEEKEQSLDDLFG